jgi:DNA ligase-1
LLASTLARHPRIHFSPIEMARRIGRVCATARDVARARVEGFMLKHRQSRYGIGRRKEEDGAAWWKWKIEPYAVDAVLVYAQPGSGRRASLYTDYTFAVWNRAPRDAEEAQARARRDGARRSACRDALPLVPFAKAYSGLTDDEIRDVDRIVRRTTVTKFGPVRSLAPTLVCEIGFEGIARSARTRAASPCAFRASCACARQAVARSDTLASLEVAAACRTAKARPARS